MISTGMQLSGRAFDCRSRGHRFKPGCSLHSQWRSLWLQPSHVHCEFFRVIRIESVMLLIVGLFSYIILNYFGSLYWTFTRHFVQYQRRLKSIKGFTQHRPTCNCILSFQFYQYFKGQRSEQANFNVTLATLL